MKSYKAFLIGVLVTLLASILFRAGTVYASTGCFTDTNGHWAETFICWLKDNGISNGYGNGAYGPDDYVTRGQMAVFLQNIHDSLRAGDIEIVMSPGNWEISSSFGTGSISKSYSSSTIRNSTTGSGYIIGFPDLPEALYGKSLALKGIEICYEASASVEVSYMDALMYTQSTDLGSFTRLINDSTVYANTGCKYHTFTPVTLNGETVVSMQVQGNWTVANSGLQLGRVTFVLSPTTTASPPLSAPPPGFGNSLQDNLPDPEER